MNSNAPETQCRMASISSKQPAKLKNLQKEILDPTVFSQSLHKGVSSSIETHLRMQGKNTKGCKGPYGTNPNSKSVAPPSTIARERSQMQQKDARDNNKVVFPDKRRKVWLPPGGGSSASATDMYKKAT
ncbi:hypothetical protein IHE45_04G062300 [Dioscorea alata]|uniref:Uncharacterized protein n=1 Tax=Dioscorea alata TaxID=55571 RepID=A0ACB7WCH6_DIOAL|nr:hypothetical protein IHE45_04G062300 [Dioscorea alata]